MKLLLFCWKGLDMTGNRASRNLKNNLIFSKWRNCKSNKEKNIEDKRSISSRKPRKARKCSNSKEKRLRKVIFPYLASSLCFREIKRKKKKKIGRGRSQLRTVMKRRGASFPKNVQAKLLKWHYNSVDLDSSMKNE